MDSGCRGCPGVDHGRTASTRDGAPVSARFKSGTCQISRLTPKPDATPERITATESLLSEK